MIVHNPEALCSVSRAQSRVHFNACVCVDCARQSERPKDRLLCSGKEIHVNELDLNFVVIISFCFVFCFCCFIKLIFFLSVSFCCMNSWKLDPQHMRCALCSKQPYIMHKRFFAVFFILYFSFSFRILVVKRFSYPSRLVQSIMFTV